MFAALFIGALLCASSLAQDYGWDVQTDLDRYVNYDDGYYSWSYLTTYTYYDGSVVVYVLNMTSQRYSDDTFTDCDIWWHFVGVAIPTNVKYSNAATMLIDGGSNRYNGEIPTQDDKANVDIATLAQTTGIISAYVGQIPNQPCIFKNDPSAQSRTEDRLIAWTWRTFVDDPNHNPNVVARLPMTKGAKRGLDCIHDVVLQYHGFYINRFLVTGASKRGWTTWSLAAVDKRVIGIAPIVFSLINMPLSFMAHFQAMNGAYSYAFEPYYNENLTQYLTSPLSSLLFDLEDMYRYRSRLTMPKLYVGGTNDEFFHPQETRFWWTDFPDPKNMFMCPNTDHALGYCRQETRTTIHNFFVNVLEGVPLPTITWNSPIDSTGKITMQTNILPVAHEGPDPRCDGDPPGPNGNPTNYNNGYLIRGYYADTLASDSRRDYRLIELVPGTDDQTTHFVAWRCANETIVHETPNTFSYTVNVDNVPEGEWRGFLIEGQWDGPLGSMFLTTEVHIIPDVYPHPPCEGQSCWGYLV